MAPNSLASESMTQPPQQFGTAGTVLEAAFVDPAYQWPPPEGVGKNAIELQASANILLDDDDSIRTTESQKERMRIPEKQIAVPKPKWWQCCGRHGGDSAILSLQEYEAAKKEALRERKKHYAQKKARAKELRKKSRYHRVPEGILIYRLDTATQTISLMSETHAETDLDALVTEFTIVSARPSPDKSRRGMVLTGRVASGSFAQEESDDDDENENVPAKRLREITLVACEQRSAIAWLEAIDLMLANKQRMGSTVSNERRGLLFWAHQFC